MPLVMGIQRGSLSGSVYTPLVPTFRQPKLNLSSITAALFSTITLLNHLLTIINMAIERAGDLERVPEHHQPLRDARKENATVTRRSRSCTGLGCSSIVISTNSWDGLSSR